jgi:DNA-nicking Smr family endonuclease
MKRRPPTITPEDAALFRDAIGEVRPIDVPETALERPRPAPEARKFKLDEAEALRESQALGTPPPTDGAELQSYRRPQVDERTLRQLKRGEFSIQDEIDLHHLRAGEAEGVLKRFLNEARPAFPPRLRSVHGKALRSERAPVLKMLVDRVLRQRGDVLAFASAPPAQGGAGAVLVLLDNR